MGWFSKIGRSKPGEAGFKADASSPQHPFQGAVSAGGCLVCPACGSESVPKVSELRRWMQKEQLDVLMCTSCGAYLLPPEP